MEGKPHNDNELPDDQTALAAERERQINEGLEHALRKGGRIDDLTAKRIARTLDPGSGSLHAFAETGAILPDVELDLATAQEVVRDIGLEQHLPRIAALREYVEGRLIKTEMPYWNDPSMD